MVHSSCLLNFYEPALEKKIESVCFPFGNTLTAAATLRTDRCGPNSRSASFAGAETDPQRKPLSCCRGLFVEIGSGSKSLHMAVCGSVLL